MDRNYISGILGEWLGNQLPPQLLWVGAWTELGNTKYYLIAIKLQNQVIKAKCKLHISKKEQD